MSISSQFILLNLTGTFYLCMIYYYTCKAFPYRQIIGMDMHYNNWPLENSWEEVKQHSYIFLVIEINPYCSNNHLHINIREALKSVLDFLTILIGIWQRQPTKYTSGFSPSNPTFNWVSFTHIHRGVIYRESYTLIPLYLILCNNIVNCFESIWCSSTFCCAHI